MDKAQVYLKAITFPGFFYDDTMGSIIASLSALPAGLQNTGYLPLHMLLP